MPGQNVTENLIKQVSPETKIWRFLTPEKFLWMIRDESVHFCQVKKFDDQNEGKMPPFMEWLRFPGSDLERMMKMDEEAPWGWRSYTGATCWHMNDEVSEKMWISYANGEGCAVQSTVENLQKCLNEAPRLGKIKYGAISYEKVLKLDRGQSLNNGDVVLFRKTSEYSYEQEYRAILIAPQNALLQTGGINIKVNLEQLIQKIYIAENQPEATKTDLLDALRKSNLNIPIEFFSKE